MSLRPTLSLIILALGAQISFAAEPLSVSPPTSGSDAADQFEIMDGFTMTLLASEPLVTDPVAICYDADGRAYVAEMNDYPYTDKAAHRPMQENPTDQSIGKIRLLTDEDGDGVFDQSTIFADGLSWPTGVTPWKGGVFVTAVPDLWYFKDTDGDGVADVKRKVATGFRKYNVQSGANTPIWGLDNRIYIATGRNKGELKSESGDVLGISAGRDLRIDPRSPDQFELVSGGIQFGNAIDDWGNRFLCSAGGSVHHVVMPAVALERNPWLPSRAAVRSCLDRADPVKLYPITAIEGWRLQRYQDRKFVPRPGYSESRGENPGDPSRPTSSCGHAVYRGDSYPEKYRDTFFVAESCYNLVYRLESERQGATFRLTKPPTDRSADFLASKDVWFRPIAMINAPDGCLHLVDFYRESIEHPWSLPESFHERMDLLLGQDRGRIYRIEPPGYQHRSPVKLSGLESLELVELLAHRNAWHRETAQRLLFERQDKSVVTALKEMTISSGEELARLHALWALHGLDALSPDVVIKACSDKSVGVRVNVGRIAATLVSDHPEILPVIVRLAEDSEPLVRFEAALALGDAEIAERDSLIAGALATSIRHDVSDSWARLAVLSSARPYASEMLDALVDDKTFLGNPHASVFLGSLAKIVGGENQSKDTSRLFSRLVERSERPDANLFSIAVGLADGLRIAKSSLPEIAAEVPGGEQFLARLIEESRVLVSDSNAAVSRRIEGIYFLRNASFADVASDLKSLLEPKVPEQIQSTAASVLSVIGAREKETGEMLLSGWDSYSGDMRNQVLQLLLAREERLGALLDAIEAGKIQPYQLGPTRREALIVHKNSEIARRAKELLDEAGSRLEVLNQYQQVTELKGDAEKGDAIYQGLCMACHRFREQGIVDLAPNLAVVSSWEPERILTNILDPNREVAPEYMEYLVETTTGDTMAGRVVSESATGITIKLADNTSRDISRSDIKTLKNSGRSLMPDGLEAAISPQAMADLIAYLRTSP